MGLSDRIGGGQLPTLESQMGDILSVMDAVGSARAVLLGTDTGGPLAILFAATYADQTAALVVYGSEPTSVWAPDYPGGWTDEKCDAYVEEHERRWGQRDYVREFVRTMAPSLTLDEQELETYTSMFRMTGGPGHRDRA
jgi:pimeloyl-ACP methyl ester carboxylesterase